MQLKNAVKGIIFVRADFSLVVYQLHDGFDIDTASLSNWPPTNSRRTRVDKLYNLLVINQNNAILNTVDDHLETQLFVTKVTTAAQDSTCPIGCRRSSMLGAHL